MQNSSQDLAERIVNQLVACGAPAELIAEVRESNIRKASSIVAAGRLLADYDADLWDTDECESVDLDDAPADTSDMFIRLNLDDDDDACERFSFSEERIDALGGPAAFAKMVKNLFGDFDNIRL